MSEPHRATGRHDAGPSSLREITSVRNPLIVERSRLHRRREREATGRYLVEGPNAVGEALADGVVEEIFVTERLLDTVSGSEVATYVVPDHVLERLADSRSPQGIVGVARRQDHDLAAVAAGPLTVVLCDVADPGNLGTVIRTSDAAGASGVVVAGEACDPYGPKAVRASAGSLTHLPLARTADALAAVAACRAAGARVLALDMGGSASVFELERSTDPVALVLGSEAHGVPAAVVAEADLVCAVPTFGRAESLNLAAAAAVAIYAAARSRHDGPSDRSRSRPA